MLKTKTWQAALADVDDDDDDYDDILVFVSCDVPSL